MEGERFGYYSITGVIIASQSASLFHCFCFGRQSTDYTRARLFVHE